MLGFTPMASVYRCTGLIQELFLLFPLLNPHGILENDGAMREWDFNAGIVQSGLDWGDDFITTLTHIERFGFYPLGHFEIDAAVDKFTSEDFDGFALVDCAAFFQRLSNYLAGLIDIFAIGHA
jgi:hypothetical protein